MRQSKFAITLLAAAMVAGCGGSGSTGGSQVLKLKYSSQVSFGDSLSDVGTYAVGTVKALGGGKFTVNDVDSTGVNASKNWTELMAAQFGLPAPCPALTGLDGSAAQGFSVPATTHAGCTGYGMGGSRVTNPVGPGNKLLGGSNALLGQLTIPVATQIQNHLAVSGGSFSGTEIVFVMAGGNDALMGLAGLSAGATAAATAAVTAAVPNQIAADIAAGTCTPTDAQATNCQAAAVAKLTPTVGLNAAGTYVQTNAPGVVAAMGNAGTELANLVKTQIVAKGANYVTVVNLPDLSTTPYALAQSASTQALVKQMVNTFNDQLKAGLAAESKVLIVDAYTVSRDQSTNPGPYGLTNTTVPACNLAAPTNPLGVSLTCNKNNAIAGDISHYMFADTVHPTPYANLLLARYVSEKMAEKGWL